MNKILSAIKRHKIISAIVVAVLAAGGYYMFGIDKKTTAVTTYTYGKAVSGTVMQTVSGTGQIQAYKQTSIVPEVSGTIIQVAIAAGKKVKAGDVIVRIDNSDAQGSVDDAKAALYNAQVSLDNVLNPDNSLSIIQAENAVLAAQKNLDNDKSDLSDSYQAGFSAVATVFNQLPIIIGGLQEIATDANDYVVQSSPTYLDYYYNSIKIYDSSASTLMTKAASSYRTAKKNYDTNFENYKSTSQFSGEADIETLLNETYTTSKAVADALKNVGNVIQNYEDNLKNHNLVPQSFADTQLTNLAGYTTTANSYVSSLLSAIQAINNAKYAIESDQRVLSEKQQILDDLRAAPKATDVQSAKYLVEQKQRALIDAQEALAKYTITAPFDGTVAAVEVEKGDKATAGTTIATVITDNQAVTVSLNEVDIAKVKVGRQATLTFDAINDLTMTGKVSEVAMIGTVSSGVVEYDVTIALDSTDSRVKPGMSTAVTIITDIAQDVLTVPSTAIKIADDGTYYVLAPSTAVSGASGQGEVIQKMVTTGLDDGTNIEIKSGLSENEQIVISSAKSTATTSRSTTPTSGSTRGAGGLFMMDGGPRD